MVNHYISSIYKTFIVLVVPICYLLFFSATLNAQSLKDTIQIETVEITAGNITRYQAGSKVEKIQPAKFELLQEGNLANLISRLTPISIKSDAGGLSSIRIRGTSPNHTSVNFGGIDLNSLTLGNSNLSNIPICLFDEVEIQYGSASAVNGSGSIGGAIHLGLKNDWTNGFKAEILSAFGSFGEQIYCPKFYFGNGKWESVTRIYYYKKTNNFKFFNTSIKDFSTGKIGVNDIQKNADIENKGILQEFNYLFAPKEFLKIMVWLENDWHHIQQNQASNYYSPDLKENYEDKNIRTWINYNNFKNKLKYHIGAGYVFDNGIYNNTKDPILTQRITGDTYIEYDSNLGSFKTGTNASIIYPTVYAYSKDLKNENRTDLFILYNKQLFKTLKISINLRKGFVTDFKLPFVPAFGVSYILHSQQGKTLKLIGNIAKSYRVPTFNDRFWTPGGNPNLLPEVGMNYELGFHFGIISELIQSSFKINSFLMDVDNWLLWRNGGSFWYAENVQRVQSKGIEITGELKYKIGNIDLINTLNGAITNAKRTESLLNSSPIGRQLEYVPLYSGVVYVSASYQNFNLSIDAHYNFEQYTDETNGNVLPPCFLLNIASSYLFDIKAPNKFSIKAMVNNVLNTNYQSSINYAMPNINYQISIVYNFK